MLPPTVGTRFSLAGYIGTVRFFGNVDGTKGDWIGVEWDDPARGKHDGIKDGRRYFSCIVPNSGSFIRLIPTIDFGKSFLKALVEKYVEVQHGSATQETVILGSSNGAIQVEAVNLDKVRQKFSRLERLREISLDKECVAYADQKGEIRSRCPSVKGLDLSYSLIPTWDIVVLIAIELPVLERLALNNNRLQPLESSALAQHAFQHITELQLNATLLTWQAVLNVLSLIPALHQLEFGYNRLTSLASEKYPETSSSSLELLNLDSNDLADWIDICQALQNFPSLNRLIVSANPLSSIPPLSTATFKLGTLKHLALSHTQIGTWSCIDALTDWCPVLEGLTLSGTPLVQSPGADRIWRQLTIARLPNLRALDGASISSRQRADAELFYLSLISRISYTSDAARRAEHPRWDALCQLHGTPDTSTSGPAKGDKLSSRLIRMEIQAILSSSPPYASAPPTPSASPVTLRILPTAPLRLLRLKLQKAFKAPRGARADVWVRMADDKLSRLGSLDGNADADESREVGWWLEEGAEIMVWLEKSG
ncbi:hypothetical protein EW146_g1699 [Bondarzewia mesenterica]|uniref:CAP-Gly domain-containing protein n=1 Tax=Bondarzewia mesenterica TaxID=1095465 RepID=A0A4S4M971_9AGAM|nr:hypothetical protein EW146_g1699 [Bondarzewia mesenterica]